MKKLSNIPNSHLKMRRNNINMRTMVQRLALCCLLLWCFMGSTMAQTDKPYVLKRQINSTDHYLTHVKNGETWVLQDATTFDPESCIWYSGPVFNVSGSHHNYYFYDEVADKYHFLSAPLADHQDLGLSADLPTTSQLKNPDEIYYFYDWDPDQYGAGVARGHDDNGWWEVYWVSYSNFYHKWMTSDDSYHIVDSSAMFREVTVTSHEKYFNWTQSEIGDLSDFSMNYNSNPASTEHPLSITIGSYSYSCTPAYTTYNFEGKNYNYQDDTFLGINVTPNPQGPFSGNSSASSYEWTISGEGASYLSFSSTAGSHELTSVSATPSVYYTSENTQGRKTATLTLTMTFGSGETMATVVRTATITVNTQCQNPAQAADPVVNHNDVTVTWYPTATRYKVEWKKASESSWDDARSAEVGNITSYAIHDLEQVLYQYRVIAFCGDDYLTPPTSPTGTFTAEAAPDLMIYGSVFGGGRAADVTGKTEVLVVNCDSIGAVYGGNDIAGSAGGDEGSFVTIGVAGTGDGHTTATIKIGSVYGGGNGYYAYGSTSFSAATASTNTIAVGEKVYALSETNQWTDSVWTNTGTEAVPLPTIKKTNITVGSDYVKVDSVFGGAKNAFVTKDRTDQNDVTTTNTLTTVNGGTIFAVFGGNNVGGTLGTARQKINVTNTKKELDLATGTVDLGRTHGIGYLFGGGNLVAGTTTDINITGGQLDTIFGGGNRASVNEAWMTVNCAGDNRISSALDNNGNILSDYGWDGDKLYNVHTLFGGNNRAHMNGVPHITLTSGGVGTAYGGGNAGDMLAHIAQNIDGTSVNYSTHMVLAENDMIVDFLYGGCQMSNVDYSTWVEIQGGHVGTVYGGCNVSGDVGSKRKNPNAPAFNGDEQNQTPNPDYQEVQGATYVKVSGGIVYRDVYAGSNGYYHCNDGVQYVAGLDFGDPDGSPVAYDPDGLYLGLSVPTHNETNVKIQGGHILGNVYAGGNLACVGFTDYTVPQDHFSGEGSYPQFVGMSFVEMSGGEVDGDVYGGGKMASVFGSNSVHVSGGTIRGALYGGNDRTGQVAQITNRVLPSTYGLASDGQTDLNRLNVKTYVNVTGKPSVNTVYGGGNGDYIYDKTDEDCIQYCGITPDEPIQSNTFVDINIDGGEGENGGYIGTVYGGGNGVTVINGITVFLNVNNPVYTADNDNVGIIYGGNNKGSLTLVPDIILLKGQVNTVYGGCNKGAMYGDYTFSTGDSTYQNVGSLVRLRNEYRPNGTGTPVSPTARVSGFVYGGCRMNGVTNNSMVIVEGHGNDHCNNLTSAEIFGGSDISGVVGGTSMVVVNGTNVTEVGDVYGGGNGHYVYQNNGVYELNDDGTTGDLIDQGTAQNPIVAPYCTTARVDMMGGICATGYNLYAGGYAALSGATVMNIVDGTVNDRAFGGGNLAGTTTETNIFDGDSYSGNGSSTVTVKGGTVNGGVYGGNNLNGTIVGDVNVNILGGTFASTSTPMADGIFGGGYGNLTRTTGNVTVTVDKITNNPAPVIYGDVYGGSGYGDVNSPRENNQDSDDITTVNILDGFISGDVYGGGLGDKASIGTGHYDYPAHINGKVYVNIGAFEGTLDVNGCPTGFTGNATIEGSVYGCNNVNGTPLDSVFVHIYSTAHAGNNFYPSTSPTTVEDLQALGSTSDYFAINAVYGGGNKAAYLPPLTSADKPRCATVHVWGCQENTIYDVYGGGNAADVGTTGDDGIPANTCVIIDGGRIHRMFGGGNGYSASGNHTLPYYDGSDCSATVSDTRCPDYNPGANLYGTASSYVYAGLIDEVYGGANQYGSIDIINLNVLSSNCCRDAVYGKVFGCANEAPINHDIVTTIGCGVGTIGELYGGSNLASIGENDPDHKANVILNLHGGTYEKVFGGSKGRLEGSGLNAVAADIYGDVTLNLYGGTVIDAFGGSDQLGSIKGIITVNVLDEEKCHLDLTNVYGGSNKANYAPWDATVQSPIVNVMHIHNVDLVEGQQVMKGIRGNVYGGGLEAQVTSNPVVNIGYDPSIVVYGETTMADLIPDDYPATTSLHNFPHAYITGDVFGGGNLAAVLGTATVNMRQYGSETRVDEIFGGGNEAGTTNSVVNVYNGKVATAVYGGCNAAGDVTNDVNVNVYGGTLGTSTDDILIFGGGLGENTATSGNVTVTIGGDDYTPNIYGTVYGGSALGSVNSGAEDITKVWLKSGTVNGRVFGGGLGQKNGVNGATSNVEAHVNGNIQVIGDGTNVTRAIFGANDQNGDPEGTVTVTINNGTIGNVMGGGSVAKYTAPLTDRDYPYVTINGGIVTNKVVGGGNEADVDGNTRILVTGGTIGTDGDATTGVGKGIYGGCNTTGDVTGNTTITLTGGTIGVNTSNTANIHGGGYGDETNVKGNVTIYFGDDTDSEKVYPLLYGELYGGSALGDVNTNDINAATASTSTIVNLRNGTINGGAYGGGLGDATNHIAAIVWGEVHVNVGAAEDIYDQSSFTGKANLVNCDVYGGNNLYGTPKQNVYVDVYQTAHDATNTVDYYVSNNWEQGNPTFAIHNVFGGGNRADYNPVSVDMRANVYAHMCENTVERLFGGSNAAAAPGVDLTIDGGHFNEVYGGGNGELIAANIGVGGIHILLGGGYIHQLVNGSNDNGTVQGPIVSETMTDPFCAEAVVEDYYLGTNHTDLFEDINATIYCGGDGNTGEMKFVNLYCGSNKAQIWGNINVTIEGGVFDNVFGGSKGDKADLGEGHENFASNIRIISDSLVQAGHAELAGRVGDGGNVNLTIIGGSIGNLYGGCDVYGNIENKINLEVYSADFIECPLFIGNIYGGANRSNYKPIETNIVNGTIYSPKVKVIKGNIGGESTRLPVKPTNPGTFEGNVFGGGEHGYVTSNPKVIVGNGPINTLPVNIEGNVFGGGSYGDVTGNPVVIVVPDTHSLTITQPESTSIGIIKATNGIGNTVSSGSAIGEDLDVNIKAIASVYGMKFNGWIVSGEGARVGRTNSATTLFTMGTADATLEASFVTATTHNFTYTFEPASSGCTVKVYDGMGQDVNSNVNISEGAELNIVALPNANGYRFDHWEITSGNGTIANLRMANTTFTMGTTATSIKAVFMTATTHTLNITQPTSGGTFTVKDNQGNTVSDGASISVGAVLDLVATPANRAYRFSEWVVTGAGARVGNANSAVTTFTMGTSNATITAVFTLPSEPEPEPEPDPQH